MKYFFTVFIVLFSCAGIYGQVIQPSGPQSFCGSGTLTASGANASTTFQWLNNNIPISGQTSASLLVNSSGNYKVVLNGGGSATDTLGPIAVTINPLPTISVNPGAFCAGSSATLTASGATSYSWSPATGLTSTTGASVIASPSVTTIYTVTGKNSNNCFNTATSVVTVNPYPTADFTFTPANQCSSVPVNFSNTSVGGATYSWDFDDLNSGSNNVSNLLNPSHKFVGLPGNTTQNFSVTLTTKTLAGCSTVKTSIVTNKQSPDRSLGGTGKVIYNGEIFFKICGLTNGLFTFTNQSSLSTNTDYRIVWGDGSPDFNATTFSSATHLYSVGPHPMLFIVQGINGCIDTTNYFAFVGTNPAVGLQNPGNTTICGNASLTFPILGTATNAPGTLYTVTFNDGTTPIVYTHPNVPSSVTHFFNKTSCGTTSSNGTNSYNNSFSASIVASNPCLSSAATVVPIHVSNKPIAAFTISPSDTVCVNTVTTFNNTSLNSYVDNGSCLNGNAVWSISPATGWNISSGTMGNDFGLADPSVWQSGSNLLAINFTVPGLYTIKIKTGSTKDCGTDEIFKTICVTMPPSPAFTVSGNAGCAPFTMAVVNTTNLFNSCQTPAYFWTVGYTPAFCGATPSWNFAPGSSNTSVNPTFIFNNPGKYTLTLSVSNACGTFPTSLTVDVKKPPTVSINLPSFPCGPVTISPTANVIACGTAPLVYSWTFAGGIPAVSSSANPGPVSFSATGPHDITLDVTNECATTSDIKNVIVTAAPDVVAPSDATYCGGDKTTAINFTSIVGPANYSWTNSNPTIGLPSNGTGAIPVFTATNSGSIPQVATITVTPLVSANCSGIPVTFTITVKPQPAAPVAASPIIYCLNAPAVALTATPASGNSLTWYSNSALTGGTAIAPTPPTSVAANTTYYVTQTNGFVCTSTATPIIISVNPSITGNVIDANQNLCANTLPAALHTLNTVSGGIGSFIYQWQSSTDGGINWANVAAAGSATYAPPVLSATTQYRRIIASSTCLDISNIVTITVQGALTNFDINAGPPICEGTTPALLNGQLPSGGGGSYTYLWEWSTDNINWAPSPGNNSGQDYQPGIIFQTTYFRRKLFASQCDAISNVVTIKVNPTPKGIINPTSNSVCEYDPATIVFTPTIGTAPFNIEVTVTTPGGTATIIQQTINNNGPVTINVLPANSSPGTYSITLSKIADANSCANSGTISTATIIVKPRPVLIVSAPPVICKGTSSNLTASGAQTYVWTPSVGLSSTTGSTVVASPNSTTTYTVTGTTNNCVTGSTVTVTVTPGTTIANAGPNQLLCNAVATTLAANIPATGTGSWLQLSGPSTTLTDATISNTAVTGLTGGQRYIFQWTITGLPPCPATISNDTIDVLSPIVNSIRNDTIVCSGQPVLLQTQNLSGGNTNGLSAQYSYQWEAASPAQNNWQVMNGETQATLLVNPTTSTCYRRTVKSNSACATGSNIVCITVNPGIGNNTISTPQFPCVNVTPVNLTGTAPTGGDNNYIYQWQTSTDNINWTDVGSNIDYQPPVYALAGVHYFRRNISSGNCTSVSNVIAITVRPDSKAIFTANPVIACAPFSLANAIKVTVLPDSNGLYEWYADGILFGSNSTGIFPGYTILNPADTVIVKLKTSSQFGCKADSIQTQFVTVITAIAKFTKDTSIGCGPLPVTFTNVSSLLNGIQFFWDFGNGVKSTLIQPGKIVFNSSPFFTDTTYKISLKAYNGCDTTIWVDSVKVSPDPKARFGVDTTFGCSPFTIEINNTSPPGKNTYYWDFGNGDKNTTTATGLFDYTYHIGNTVDTFTIRLIAENQCRRDTQTLNVRVAPNTIRPLINVNSSELFGCASHTVTFINSSTGATSFKWDFGDGTPTMITNNNQNVIVHPFKRAGIFTVKIDITNGCSDTTVFRKITVYARPVASFAIQPVYCKDDTVRVTNNSVNATNYRWFWGDGITSVAPEHIYASAGTYPVLLRAELTDSSGLVCYDTIVRPVNILAKPPVLIQSNINSINCAPFTLRVAAPGIINENVSWYFYDSTVTPMINSATGISAQYVFKKPGSFYVKMVAVNAAGCKDSSIVLFTVRGNAVASFTPSSLAICTRDTTIVFNSTSTYNGTDAISYQWLVDNVPSSPFGTFTHRFTVLPTALLPRAFNISLVVSNTVGCSDTASAKLQMNPVAKAQFSIANPTACVPFKPIITNTSTYATSRKWLLNGILADTAAIPNIAITQSSTVYTITLIVNNIYACKPDTLSATFTSRVRPAAAFTLSDTLGCTGVLNLATVNTTTLASSYIWNWGDGSAPSSFFNASHSYTTQGQYILTLVASDGVCTDTAQQVVKVSVKPKVDFSVDQTITCDTARVQFTNLTQNGKNYSWNFGDGSFSDSTNPSKSYIPRAAAYTVKLVASSNFGCKDSAVKANLVLAKIPPASNFFISPTPVITVPAYTFNFNNLTLNSVNYKYLWSLGDGSFANTRDVTHKYTDTGNYTIRLIVLDTATNCPDTTIKIARIDGFPGYLYVPNAICPACIQSGLRAFMPKGIGLKEYRLQIYTTWNELVFESRALDSKGSPTEAWDGTWHTRPKRTNVQQDVYVWRIDAKLLNGSEWLGMTYPGEGKYKKTGTITVVR